MDQNLIEAPDRRTARDGAMITFDEPEVFAAFVLRGCDGLDSGVRIDAQNQFR